MKYIKTMKKIDLLLIPPIFAVGILVFYTYRFILFDLSIGIDRFFAALIMAFLSLAFFVIWIENVNE